MLVFQTILDLHKIFLPTFENIIMYIFGSVPNYFFNDYCLQRSVYLKRSSFITVLVTGLFDCSESQFSVNIF